MYNINVTYVGRTYILLIYVLRFVAAVSERVFFSEDMLVRTNDVREARIASMANLPSRIDRSIASCEAFNGLSGGFVRRAPKRS